MSGEGMMYKKSKGSAAIILSFVMAGMLCFTAYVVDIGMVYAERIKLSNAIDSAALAGVLELPNSPSNSVATAQDYLQKNGVTPGMVTVTIGSDNKSIEIKAVKQVNHLFAKVMGIGSSNIKSVSKAVIGPTKAINGGIKPFAVVAFDYTYGTQVTLKEDAGDGYRGNYGAVALGGNGANTFENNAIYGYDGRVAVGDWVNTEPGNMGGASNAIKNYINSEHSTFDNFPRDSIRVWTIPLVNTLTVDGRKQVQVTGFAEFFVEDVTEKSGKIQITGRFTKFVVNADIDMTLEDTGAYGAKLSE